MKMMKGLLAATVATVAFVAVPANATVYMLNRSFTGGSAVGTITTDNTIGALSTQNISAFNITVTLAGLSDTITTANARAYVAGNALTATSTALNFDFNTAGINYALFYKNDGSTFYCAQTQYCFTPATTPGEGIRNPGFAQTSTALSGTLEIASANAGAVPEPASWAMMILGMGVVGGALRRRSKVSTTVKFA